MATFRRKKETQNNRNSKRN